MEKLVEIPIPTRDTPIPGIVDELAAEGQRRSESIKCFGFVTSVGRSDGGLLSALSSYLLTPYGASTDSLPAEPTSDDIENTLSTMDCISSCKLDELYSQLM